MKSVDVLLGLQWGDEGKGKIVDYLAPGYDVVARFQGGPNAGHTLNIAGKKRIVLHTIPSGVFHERPMNLIGNGVVIDPIEFKKEAEELTSLGADLKKKLLISQKAHLIIPTHRLLDAASESAKAHEKIGSTLKGIGPTYMDKTGRNGLRIGDVFSPDFKSLYQKLKEKHLAILKMYNAETDVLVNEEKWFEAIEFIRTLNTTSGEYYINQMLDEGKQILAEGAQGSMLDIDFGTYPYVTSSNTITAAACTGLGIPPSAIREVLGVTKAYCTRVGSGPFPTELLDETGDQLRKAGNEFGSTTGRPRRCGWIDMPALRYAIMLNGVTQLIITKSDVLNIFDSVNVCTAYRNGNSEMKAIPFEINTLNLQPFYRSMPGWKLNGNETDSGQLPPSFHGFLKFLETESGVKVSMVSTGVGREQLIRMK